MCFKSRCNAPCKYALAKKTCKQMEMAWEIGLKLTGHGSKRFSLHFPWSLKVGRVYSVTIEALSMDLSSLPSTFPRYVKHTRLGF
jgi:hypothetical protein